MPLHIPPVVELEGEYTTWNHVWNRDYGVGVKMYLVFVSNIGTVYASDEANRNLYVRTLGGVETNLADYEFASWADMWMMPVSATVRYLLSYAWLIRTVNVWKDGAIQWSRAMRDDNPDFDYVRAMSISPSGEYVAVSAASFAGGIGNARWLTLYQGV